MVDTTIPESPLRIALIGAGRVGPAVAALLQDAGHIVTGVASRTPGSAAAAAARLAAPVFDLDAELPDATVVLVAVPDAAIGEVGERIGPRMPPGVVLCHFAGALGIEVLGPAGRRACALHPVQACPSVDLAIKRLPGSAWGVTCTRGLQGWAHHVVEADLRGKTVAVAEEHRALWHAATVTAANGITALLCSAEEMLRVVGIERPLDVLGPLAAGAVDNARDAGAAASVLTGPAIRGDVATIRRHLEAVTNWAPEQRDVYELAARLTVAAARRSGTLGAGTDAELVNVLEDQ